MEQNYISTCCIYEGALIYFGQRALQQSEIMQVCEAARKFKVIPKISVGYKATKKSRHQKSSRYRSAFSFFEESQPMEKQDCLNNQYHDSCPLITTVKKLTEEFCLGRKPVENEERTVSLITKTNQINEDFCRLH